MVQWEYQPEIIYLRSQNGGKLPAEDDEGIPVYYESDIGPLCHTCATEYTEYLELAYRDTLREPLTCAECEDSIEGV